MNQETLKKKVYKIPNKKLQTALRIQLLTGMRISEIGELKKEDIFISDEVIIIKCKAKKGSIDRTIIIKEHDPWLHENLKIIISAAEDRIFYTPATLKKYASERGIKTNDLKKIRAKELYHKAKRAGLTKEESEKFVQKNLGHKRLSNSKIYINSKSINMDKNK